MNAFGNMKIGLRLSLGFGAMLVLLALITAVSISRFSKLSDDIGTIADETYPKSSASQAMSYLVMDQARAIRNLMLIGDSEGKAKNKAVIDKDRAAIREKVDYLEKHVVSGTGKALLSAVLSARLEYVAFNDDVVALAMQGKNAEASELLFGPRYKTQTTYLAALAELSAHQDTSMSEAAVKAKDVSHQALLLVLVIAGVSTLVGVAAAIVITRSITQPINEAVKVAQTVAAGDLTSQIQIHGKDETGQLLAALDAMNKSLVGIVSNVRQSSDSIATGTAQIATGNADLSQRTEEQASNLQQTAASMEQLTATVKQNSDTARQANQLANGASEAAAHGGVVVGRVVGTMQEIAASSKKISDIIGVIDGIAFQTNILALNAAVEAARAGEQGRGFAVVASEVRSLAQRSAGAAKEIKSLIGQSVEKVEAGSRLVDDAGKSMQDIVAQVNRVNDLIGEISAASLEQTQGIGQVGDAVSQLDQVTQQNAALVEESAAAAESLSQQATRLTEVVAVFKVRT